MLMQLQVGNGVQDGTNQLAQGVKDKGQWK